MADKTTFLFAVAVIVCTFVYNVQGLADAYYMEDYCALGSSRQFHVGDNGVLLHSQRGERYEYNRDCTVTFYASVGQVLVLSSQMIKLEDPFDCITLFDGQDTSSPPVKHCKNNQLRYFTTERYLTIQMTTDGSLSYAGFRLHVNTYTNTNADTYYMEDYCTGSANQLRVGDNGFQLYSQRGTNYGDNRNCTMTFYTTVGQVLILRSQSIELQETSDCIKLFDGQDTFMTPVSHCSNELLLYFTTQRHLTIQMTTDASINHAGFHLSVVTTTSDNYYMEDYCSGSRNQLQVESGDYFKIYSQRDLTYGDNLDCTMTFYTDVGQVLVLTSERIELRFSDCIKLYDSQFTFTPSKIQCNNNQLTYITTQMYLTIQFTTDNSVDFAGFIFTLTSANSTDTLPCTSGYGQYQCRDGNGCYGDINKCDSYSICGDKTDDLNCDHCDYNAFHCVSSRQCVADHQECDGTVDCLYGEDENLTECHTPPCTSGYGQYQCRDGNGCYSDTDKCDSYSTCGDKTDDLNCDQCVDYSAFHCVSSRQCVADHQVCDGTVDCLYGEDEDLPECHPSIWMYWSGGQVAGFIIGYVIFLVIVIATVIVVKKKCKK